MPANPSFFETRDDKTGGSCRVSCRDISYQWWTVTTIYQILVHLLQVNLLKVSQLKIKNVPLKWNFLTCAKSWLKGENRSLSNILLNFYQCACVCLLGSDEFWRFIWKFTLEKNKHKLKGVLLVSRFCLQFSSNFTMMKSLKAHLWFTT